MSVITAIRYIVGTDIGSPFCLVKAVCLTASYKRHRLCTHLNELRILSVTKVMGSLTSNSYSSVYQLNFTKCIQCI